MSMSIIVWSCDMPQDSAQTVLEGKMVEGQRGAVNADICVKTSANGTNYLRRWRTEN